MVGGRGDGQLLLKNCQFVQESVVLVNQAVAESGDGFEFGFEENNVGLEAG